VRPATAWINDIQKQITVGGQKHFRGENPERGTAISYWLKSDANDVKVEISDVTGRVIRTMDGTKTAGLNRVRWTLQGNPLGGRGAGRAEQPAATAPSAQPPAANPPATPPATGQQGAGREDRPAAQGAQAQGGRGAEAAAPAQGRAGAQGGRGGRGRGGFAPPVAPGTYLAKVIVNGKVVGQKTITVEADSLN
jgi:hypothetical protein